MAAPNSDPKFNAEDQYDEPLLPSAEAYEAQSNDIDLLIRDLKRSVSSELQDELSRLQYLLTKKEEELKVKEIQLQQKEAELAQREAQLNLIAQSKEPSSPPSEEFPGLNEDEASLIREYRNNNPQGTGGHPGSLRSNAIVIHSNKFQGDSVPLDDDNALVWNPDEGKYNFSKPQSGLKFTFFAVEAAYLNEGYINPNYPQFYSTAILQKQVWYERTPKNRFSDGIGEQYQGEVPLDILMGALNLRLNSAALLPNGTLIENQDFRRAYRNWRYSYQVGTYYKNRDGDLYTVLKVDESDSKGNPPTYRSDNKPGSKTFGERKSTSFAERVKWKGSI